MTRTGKIARLPRNIRDELNQRLENGEPGASILSWLNALPEAQTALVAKADAGPINEQNLSNWRQGGYQDWLKQQERRALVRELAQNADELAADAGGVEVANHLSAVLVAEFAASAREVLAAITDPAERCVREQEFLQTLVRVRRQDSLAGRLAIERERLARERTKEKEKDARRKQAEIEWGPTALLLKRCSMVENYGKPDIFSQSLATQNAESLLRDVKSDPNMPAHAHKPNNRQSN